MSRIYLTPATWEFVRARTFILIYFPFTDRMDRGVGQPFRRTTWAEGVAVAPSGWIRCYPRRHHIVPSSCHRRHLAITPRLPGRYPCHHHHMDTDISLLRRMCSYIHPLGTTSLHSSSYEIYYIKYVFINIQRKNTYLIHTWSIKALEYFVNNNHWKKICK